ncbi:MAG: hypothetical protein QOG68_402, partial [Solirubrobacteraceae bacterium]|nr:hypothetical protein [Solirubrobacteraceae bacterium]
MAGLHVEMESTLPGALPVGRATAVFLAGRCSGARVEAIRVDGIAQPATAAGGGWWATVDVPARAEPGEVVFEAVAGGRTVELGRTAVHAAPAEPLGTDPGLIAVCMATFEPDQELFAAQVESLRAQTDTRWTCVISDDASEPTAFAALEAIVGADPRFRVVRGTQRLGFYGNFERALALAPPEAGLIALCDQDDRWHPDKLATLRGALGDAGLVYSDQRLVDRDGRVLRDTLWSGRRNNHTDIVSLLVANSVTGAAALMRREVAEVARPFPEPPGFRFHDHWIGLVALALGDVAYVDRPLYDYVQHQGAVFGDVATGSGPHRRRPPGAWRAAYFYGFEARALLARTLIARGATPAKRRALERFVAAEHSPAALA